MQNLKYHALNIISVLIFSYILASMINQAVKYNMSPSYNNSAINIKKRPFAGNVRKKFDDYKTIIDSGFFKIPGPSDLVAGSQNAAGAITELTLIGTITGSRSIARAMIMKNGEKYPGIFALYKFSNEVTSDVYGNKLVSIADTKVYLEANGEKVTLELFAPKTFGPHANLSASGNASTVEGRFTQTLSRSEIKQKVLNNLDNALRGLQAGPYRVNGQIAGYRLITVRPYSILYRFGARSGDIIKRINGQLLDSTQKLYSIWEAAKNDPKITVDIQRAGKNLQFDFNITQ
jgi:type II secretion system protein C